MKTKAKKMSAAAAKRARAQEAAASPLTETPSAREQADLAAALMKMSLRAATPEPVSMESSTTSLVSLTSAATDDSLLDIPTSSKPFCFFDLPSEIRLRIYELILVVPDRKGENQIIDLDPTNFRTISPLLSLFYVSRRMHDEAYRVFYGYNIFRLFPVHGRFFHTKWPLLTLLPARYRREIRTIELRLGPGFTGLPRGWVIKPALGLNDLTSLRILKIFVECDPAADDVFRGFRKSEHYFTQVSRELLQGVLNAVRSVEKAEFDAWPFIWKKGSPLLRALIEEAEKADKRVMYGPQRSLEEKIEGEVTDLMAGLAL